MGTRPQKVVLKPDGKRSHPLEVIDLSDDQEVPDPIKQTEFIYGQTEAKVYLNQLNERFATYIEKVRSLETDNAHLVLKIREIELERQSREANIYDNKQKHDELLRQFEIAKTEYTRVEKEKKQFDAKLNAARAKFEKTDRDFKSVSRDRDHLQERLTCAKNDLNFSEARLHKAEKELNLVKKSMSAAMEQNKVMQSKYIEETTLSKDLQTRIENELFTYDKLLSDEERRLHIQTPETSTEDLSLNVTDEPIRQTSNVSSSFNSTVRNRSLKRRRSLVSEDYFYSSKDDLDDDKSNSWTKRFRSAMGI